MADVMLIDEWLNQPMPEVHEIIGNGVLPMYGRLIIFGPPKTWKSNLATHLGYAISHGIPFLGVPTTRAAVYILQAELPETMYHERLKKYRDSDKLSMGWMFARA